VFNLRDIGGPAATGGRIRTGLLWRSNALVDLDDAGRARIRELGLVSALDLRERGEREGEPSDLADLRIAVHDVPLIDGDSSALSIDLLEFNQWLLRERGPRLAHAVGLLAAPGALPGVYFCSTGKDRTGIVTGLILSALGVDDDAVAADYALTAERLPDDYAELALERARRGGLAEEMEARYLEFGLASPAPVMRGMLQTVRDEYGGAAAYLLAHGLGDAELDGLRNTLVAADLDNGV
jgi:protein-tyrosine phosphatase